jgi:hypothetical protein
MSRVIHKLHLHSISQKITISAGAFKVLTVHNQNDVPTIWYETLEKPVIPIEVCFKLVGTGDDVPENSVYVDTAFCDEFVWHVYQSPVL